MTYRSSEAQLANLRPGANKKGEVARDAFVSAKITAQSKATLQSHLKSHKMSFGDLLEVIGEKLERGELTLDDILKN